MRLVLLPGMDGGGALLAPFARALPPWITPSIVTYPPESTLGYDALEAMVRARLTDSSQPVALLAESFSGPIAIRIGASPPPQLCALILVATFTHAPSWIPSSLVSRPPPRALLWRALLSTGSSDTLGRAVRAAIRRPSPEVLAHRMRAALEVDVRADLARITLPILVLEGRRDRLLRGRTRWPTTDVVRLDTPHLVLASAPEEGAARVARFLACISPDPVR